MEIIGEQTGSVTVSLAIIPIALKSVYWIYRIYRESRK